MTLAPEQCQPSVTAHSLRNLALATPTFGSALDYRTHSTAKLVTPFQPPLAPCQLIPMLIYRYIDFYCSLCCCSRMDKALKNCVYVTRCDYNKPDKRLRRCRRRGTPRWAWKTLTRGERKEWGEEGSKTCKMDMCYLMSALAREKLASRSGPQQGVLRLRAPACQATLATEKRKPEQKYTLWRLPRLVGYGYNNYEVQCDKIDWMVWKYIEWIYRVPEI